MAAEKNCWFLSVGGAEPEQFTYKVEAKERLDELLPGQYSRKEGEDYQLWSERFCEPVDHAIQNLKTIMKGIMRDLSLTEFDVRMCLSGGKNYRYDIATTRPYKGNRDKSHRPTHEEALRNYISATWDTYIAENEEADDVMGIMCTAQPHDTVIVTIDKDLDMIPGDHYNFVKGERYTVDQETATHNFYMQLLTGDSVDNIQGIAKVGPARAAQILDGLSLDDQWIAVVSTYMSRAGEDWEAYLREQGQLLWIRTKEHEMWEPDLSHLEVEEEATCLEMY